MSVLKGYIKTQCVIKAKDEKDKIVDDGIKECLKTIKSNTKSWCNRIESAFEDAFDDSNIKLKKVNFDGVSQTSTNSSTDAWASFEVFGNMILETELEFDEVVEILEGSDDKFSDNIISDGHLVFEGASPISDEEITVLNDGEESGDIFQELSITAGGFETYSDFARCVKQIKKGRVNSYEVAVWSNVDWLLDF